MSLQCFRSHESKIMQRFRWNFIHANPNFHMQIRLSQQSLSPSHHFSHSNAFSHLFKTPPLPARTSRMCSFYRLVIRDFCTFLLSSEEMYDKCDVLHVLLLRRSGDNKKWTRLEIWFLYDASPCSALNRRHSVYMKALPSPGRER